MIPLPAAMVIDPALQLSLTGRLWSATATAMPCTRWSSRPVRSVRREPAGGKTDPHTNHPTDR
jgi:hypothetical protein